MEQTSSHKHHSKKDSSHRDRKHRRSRSRSHSRDHDRNPKSHSSRKRDRSRDGKAEDKSRRKDDKKRRKEKGKEKGMKVVDDDGDEEEEDMWVEKGGEESAVASIPTADSLKLTSHASQPTTASLPQASTTTSGVPSREDWMLAPAREASGSGDNRGMTEGYGDEEATNARTMDGGVDFFSDLGTELRGARVREQKEKLKQEAVAKPVAVRLGYDPTKAESANKSPSPPPPPRRVVPGAAGSTWRMQKLRRTYETAEEEGRPVEELAMERYGSMVAWEDALEERRVLDERDSRRRGGSSGRAGGTATPQSGGETRYMFTENHGEGGSRPGSRAGFRKPQSDYAPSPRGTPGLLQSGPGGVSRVDLLRQQQPSASTPTRSASHSSPGTPIPSVMTPSVMRPPVASGSNPTPVLTSTGLNKLQAALLRAKLLDRPDIAKLEREYQEALDKSREEGGKGTEAVEERVEMVPTLDGRGRMYDLGKGEKEEAQAGMGNRRKKEAKVETRDLKTGELLRLNADDDSTTLGDMVRQERFGAGAADQKNMDAEMAKRIMTDAKYENDLDYIDDNADRLARKKIKSDSSKRLFAINDFARTKKALDSCHFCSADSGAPPRAAIIASGTQSYLACPLTEELVEGHCLIVPMHHCLSMLEADDDVWDEVKNFMKCLMKMFADRDQGVLFFETVLSFKQQKHTWIEAVPLQWDMFEDAPAYFRESIVASEAEWSQNKKLIDFSKRPGGFRRSLVSNLPYFMVQWDYKGEKGYGHVIEKMDESAGQAGEDENGEVNTAAIVEEENRGGEIQKYFAHEIIGNMLDLEPRKWRRPRRMDQRQNKDRIAKFLTGYKKYDWTGMLAE